MHHRALSCRPARAALLGALLAIVFGAWGCGGGSASSSADAQQPPKSQPQWTYAPNSLELRFHADKMLNAYDEQGHTLILCVYQLSDPNGYNKLAKTQAGLRKLLECKDFDKTAVYYQRLVVQPGEDQVAPLNRAEKAKWVAVAAGYYDLAPQRSTRLFEIPVITRDEGFFTTDLVRNPGKLLVNLFLGPTGIQLIGSE